MINQVNPFDGGFSAKLVVNDKSGFLSDIVNGLKSVVCVATLKPNGELAIELISRQDRRITEALHNENGLTCLSLPLLVIRADHDATAHAAPEMVGRRRKR